MHLVTRGVAGTKKWGVLMCRHFKRFLINYRQTILTTILSKIFDWIQRRLWKKNKDNFIFLATILPFP